MTDVEARYRVLSYRFAVRTAIPSVGAEIDRFLVSFRSRDDPEGAIRYEISADHSGYSVHVGGDQVYATTHDRDVVSWLLSDIHASAIDRERSDLVIHAGTVSWGGKGVMLPAAPDSGKTTTVAGLVRAGFDYLTDESTIVDPGSLELVPYPLALKMERPSIEAVFGAVPGTLDDRLGVFTRIHPDEIRPGSIGDRCRLGFIVFPRYVKGGPTTLEPVNRADALVATAMQTVNLKRFGARGFHVLRELLSDVACYRLEVGELDRAVRLVTRLVEAPLAGVAAAPAALDGLDAERDLHA